MRRATKDEASGLRTIHAHAACLSENLADVLKEHQGVPCHTLDESATERRVGDDREKRLCDRQNTRLELTHDVIADGGKFHRVARRQFVSAGDRLLAHAKMDRDFVSRERNIDHTTPAKVYWVEQKAS